MFYLSRFAPEAVEANGDGCNIENPERCAILTRSVNTLYSIQKMNIIFVCILFFHEKHISWFSLANPTFTHMHEGKKDEKQ